MNSNNQDKSLGLMKRLGLKNLSEADYFPKYFEIETIRACNARCSMCPVWKLDSLGNIMEDNLFLKFLNEIRGYSNWIERVCLSRNGEPLLDQKLSEKIRQLKEIGINEVSFSTNASLLTEERSIELINSGLDDIRFSMDGITKETFESIRNGLDYDKVLKNCLRFIELRNQRGTKPKIQVRMVLQKKNEHEEKEFKLFWLEKLSEQDVVSSKLMHSWGTQLDNYEGRENEDKLYESTPCVSLFGTMIVHFDGKIPLCGCDFDNKILLGDLNTSSVKGVWNSEKLKELRKLHLLGLRNNIPICRGCNVWDIEVKKED